MRRSGASRVFVVGHDIGTSVATELMARDLRGQLTSERSFRAQFSRVFSPQHPLSDKEAADQWSLLIHNGGQRIAHRTINYMAERPTIELPDAAHYPQIEQPEPISAALGPAKRARTATVLPSASSPPSSSQAKSRAT